MGFGIEFNLINALSVVVNNTLSIYEVIFLSETHIFVKINPDYLILLNIREKTLGTIILLKKYAQIAQILGNFAHVSVFKNIAQFAFKMVFKY